MTLSTSSASERADITLTNMSGQTQLCGVSDSAGTPYLAIDTKDQGTTEFVVSPSIFSHGSFLRLLC